MERSLPPISLGTFSWLPHSLEDMYNSMLSDHSIRSGIPQGLQSMIFRCVTHSIRSLRLLELAALLHHSDASNLIKIMGRENSVEDFGETKALVRTACGPLLEILPDETISVIHHSFTEFLLDSERKGRLDGVSSQFPVIYPMATHCALAVECLKYMDCLVQWHIKHRDGTTGLEGEPDANHGKRLQELRIQYPFIDYAMNNWHVHIRKLDALYGEHCFNVQSGTEHELLLHTLDDFMHRNVFKWLDLVWPSSGGLKRLGSTSKVTPLHVAAWSGLVGYSRLLIKDGAQTHCLDGQRMTPLSWATLNGHDNVVALLIQHDPQDNYESPTHYHQTPLHFATRQNHDGIVQQLLVAGADPFDKKSRLVPALRHLRKAPFHVACRAGSVESVSRMIPYLPVEYLDTALCDAIRYGKKEIVQVLFTSPAISVDGGSTLELTPLILAAKDGNYSIIEMLLARGADPNKAKSNNYGPLHALFSPVRREQSERSNKLTRCLRMLLEAGAEVNAVDISGETPLHRSVSAEAFESDPVLTRLLLENGASVTARDERGNTPLHNLHVRSNSSPIIDLLISHGADLQAARLRDRKTLLHLAVGDIRAQDINPILKHITNCNAVDSQGNTPLHLALAALANGRISDGTRYKADMVSDLMKAGADPNIRNNKGLTPVHLLAGNGISHHNSTEIGLHELYYNLLRNRVLPDLLAGGANLECTDYDGRPILLRTIAIQGYQVGELLLILLNLGANINTRDYLGDTALHLLCRHGRDVNLVESFIERGADLFATNNTGSTPLHEVSRAVNSLKLTNLLLKKGLLPTAQNNNGQTPLHIICGTLMYKMGPDRRSLGNLQAMLKTELVKGLCMKDNNGVQPIHLAASISEDYVGQLVAVGADPTAITTEGRTALHIAALARQSNVVGYILDIYASIGRSDLINSPDDSGLTALHEACRSGRPETVKLLLDAGAKIDLEAKLGDTLGNTPLHACATFEEEKIFWSPVGRRISLNRPLDAAGILIADTSRPPLLLETRKLSDAGYRMFDPIAASNIDTYTARVRDIVEMLIQHGANISALNCRGLYPIDMAVDLGCEEMVEVLLPHMDKVYAAEKDDQAVRSQRSRFGRSRNRFAENYLSLRGRYIAENLDKDIIQGQEITTLCGELLALGKIETLKKLQQMGVSFAPRPGETSFLQVLASCGYSSLLRDLGRTVEEPWVEGQGSSNKKNIIFPFLLTACQRTLPNLDVIKVLVETFGANVSYLSQSDAPLGGVLLFSTALHALARKGHWWQIKAVEYLLQRGADPELEDETGCTVLHSAITFGRIYTRRQAVELLLKHGSNPNAIDKTGLSCLNKAVKDVGLMKVLIKQGADVNLGIKPPIFSAIEDQQTDAVSLLLEFGANPNSRSSYSIENGRKQRLEHDLYPLLAAASEFFDLAKLRAQSVVIIGSLLYKCANPYLVFNNIKEQATIIHHLLEHGGVLQPFLELPDLQLEHRDPQGRTLLLAACRSRFGTTDPPTLDSNERQLFLKQVNWEERQAEERVTFKTQLILAHKLYELGSNLFVQDSDGNNALHLLLSKTPSENSNFDKAVALFIEKGPSLIHQKNKAGFKPLHIAFRTKRMWPMKALISAGGDTNEADPDGNTVLHFLAQALHSSTFDEELISNFKFFLSLGVSINWPNSLGETPIFWYFRSDSSPATPSVTASSEMSFQPNITTFLDTGTDLFHKNNEGETLLHMVAGRFRGNPVPKHGSIRQMNKEKELFEKKTKDTVEEFKWLLEKGLDPMVEDMAHRTPLDVAAASGNEGILELFRRDTI